jgi:hypothetical protein
MLKSNPKENTLNISRELEKEYKLPFKDLHIIAAEARKELKSEKEIVVDQEENKLVEERCKNDDGIRYDTEEVLKMRQQILTEQSFNNSNKLKIKAIEIEGENGRTYFKSQEGVKLGDKLYKDITDVKHEIEVLESNTKATEDKINKKIEELKKQLKIELEYEKKELEKYSEIEIVFAM